MRWKHIWVVRYGLFMFKLFGRPYYLLYYPIVCSPVLVSYLLRFSVHSQRELHRYSPIFFLTKHKANNHSLIIPWFKHFIENLGGRDTCRLFSIEIIVVQYCKEFNQSMKLCCYPTVTVIYAINWLQCNRPLCMLGIRQSNSIFCKKRLDWSEKL